MLPARAALLTFASLLELSACSNSTRNGDGGVEGGGGAPSGDAVGETPNAMGLAGVAASDDASSTSELDAPDKREQLLSFLQRGSYSDWHAEPVAHASYGPHGPEVRVFYGPKAAAALGGAFASFPQGAATIKELRRDGVRYGWSVWVKVEAESAGGNGFFWYEDIGTMSYVNERGSPSCVGCHSAGKDFLRSTRAFE